MSESKLEIFEQVVDMIIEEDPAAPPKTPAFIKILSLQLTRAEADLALKVRTTGGTLDELVERTGIKPCSPWRTRAPSTMTPGKTRSTRW
jgi:hypothetical protein